jgi:sugar/nucleoside kinase (ribokinase family)
MTAGCAVRFELANGGMLPGVEPPLTEPTGDHAPVGDTGDPVPAGATGDTAPVGGGRMVGDHAVGRRFDVVMQGTVFLDIVLTGLSALPSAGTEVPAEGMGSCPGGIANLAIAASRLGLSTALAATFGDDLYGDFLVRTLQEEGIDLSLSRQISQWHSPVTVSLAVQRDRSMITHSHPSPIPDNQLISKAPSTAAGVVHLGQEVPEWVPAARANGTLLFGDVGWDATQQWSTRTIDQIGQLHAFLPNSAEAMAYTRTDDPRAALMQLADAVPVVVITCGGQGAIGVDSITGEEEWVPSLPVNAVDATGAGDVFAAAFVVGTLRSWPLRTRMAFANLCAALSVQQVGGSLAAPGWGDLADWLARVRQQAAGGSRAASVLLHSYQFLTDALPQGPSLAVRRATATIARRSDA